MIDVPDDPNYYTMDHWTWFCRAWLFVARWYQLDVIDRT